MSVIRKRNCEVVALKHPVKRNQEKQKTNRSYEAQELRSCWEPFCDLSTTTKHLQTTTANSCPVPIVAYTQRPRYCSIRNILCCVHETFQPLDTKIAGCGEASPHLESTCVHDLETSSFNKLQKHILRRHFPPSLPVYVLC